MTTAVEKRRQELSKNAWSFINKMKPAILAVLPQHVTPERMGMLVFTAMRQNPKLMECTEQSIMASIMTASILGLEPFGPLQHGALIPYKGECQFQPMYKGLLELAYRTGLIKDVQAAAVYAGDQYIVERGLEPKLEHKPKPGGINGREPIAVYCVIRLLNGGVRWEEMSYKEAIEHGEKYSRTYDSKTKKFMKDTPWETNPVEMAVKTVIIKTLKLAPKSANDKGRVLAGAMSLDEQTESGKLTPMGQMEQIAGDVFDVDLGPEPNATAAVPGEKMPTENGKSTIDRIVEEKQASGNQAPSSNVVPNTEVQRHIIEQQFAGSLEIATTDDFKDIETVAHDCGIPVDDVYRHITDTMGFKSFRDLTRGRLAEVHKWIRATSRK
jgi:recombination protein RecT